MKLTYDPSMREFYCVLEPGEEEIPARTQYDYDSIRKRWFTKDLQKAGKLYQYADEQAIAAILRMRRERRMETTPRRPGPTRPLLDVRCEDCAGDDDVRQKIMIDVSLGDGTREIKCLNCGVEWWEPERAKEEE